MKEAARDGLLPALEDAIDLRFRLLDCHRSTYRRHTSFVLAITKFDFPSPNTSFEQLNDGVFNAFVLDKPVPHNERSRT